MKKIQAWPMAIIIALVIFMVMTLGFVHVAFSERVDLVAKDYYYRDKQFSQRIDKEKRLLELGETHVTRTPQGIAIALPTYFRGREIKGKAFFYSPLNPAEDFEIPLVMTGADAKLSIPLKAQQKWRVTLDFSSDGQDYFVEKVVW